jgi:hypothetical protein
MKNGIEILKTNKSLSTRLNNMTEEEVLEKVEKAHIAYEASTSDWAKTYWLTVLSRLKNRFPVH